LNEPLETHHIHDATDPAFTALARIYSDAIPASERKSVEQLSSMLQRPEYIFLVASRENLVVGFSITLCFTGCDACLLEYMAVVAGRRSQGIGRYLFTELTKHPEVSGRLLLAEVDSDKTQSSYSIEAAQRKAFYRKLGCKEVEGLHYLMPPVTTTTPPEMNLLAYQQALPSTIERAHLQTWLQCIYVEVYGRAATDPGLEQMLKSLPDNIRLT
jgi:ribosomal protein S18 acetylase RimI-like enzyme